MTELRWHTLWRSVRSRLPASLALVAYLVVAVGVPLPAFPHKDAGQPFPCQEHPCGCQTAEQCWRHCCCFTPEERWAWAEAHHVTPPPYAEKPAALARHTARLRDRAEGQTEPPPDSPCCAHAAKGCCHDRPRCASCCHSERGADTTPPPADRPVSRVSWRWTVGVDALRCQGVNTLWVACGAALPLEPPFVWGPWPAPSDWVPFSADFAVLLPASPPVPPPRLPAA
jgi:hypothetical protein